MPEHPNLFDVAAAEAARDKGIALVGGNDPVLALVLRRAIATAAKTYREFTSDSIWAYLTPEECKWVGGRPNSLGAAFRAAACAGLIEATGRIEKSGRVAAHRRTLQVWKSLVFWSRGVV